MALLAAILFSLFGYSLAQTSCIAEPTNTFSQVVIRYTPYMTPQIAPTSTVWQQIVTSWFNVVDCRYVTPLRVDENPVADGPFYTYVYSPTLTVTRVGCMPETTAVTRREVRGQEHLEPKTLIARRERKMEKRHTTAEAVDTILEQISAAMPPNTSSLTVEAFRYLTALNTAIFGLNIVNAGLDLNQTCEQLHQPATEARLLISAIDPVQASDIVCFAALKGLYFSGTYADVVANLQRLIYAVQAKSASPGDTDELCNAVDTTEAGLLGIDAEGLETYLCPGQSAGPSTSEASVSPESTTTSNIRPSGATSGSAASSYGNSTASGASSGLPPYAGATEAPGPYANLTAGNTVGGGPTGTRSSGGVSGTGVVFQNTTSFGGGTSVVFSTGNLPRIPASALSSAASANATRLPRVRRW